MTVLRFYQSPALTPGRVSVVSHMLQNIIESDPELTSLETEFCFYIDVNNGSLNEDEQKKVIWILSTAFQERCISDKSAFPGATGTNDLLIEIGPRLNFSTAFSSNAVSIFHSIGLSQIERVERSIRYYLKFTKHHCGQGDIHVLDANEKPKIVSALHDRMTEMPYNEPIQSFKLDVKTEPLYEVDVMNQGRQALANANKQLGLGMDDWDLDYYTNMFRDKIKRNPSNVECFDLAQSNSEHSRHWFFKGKLIVNGQEEKQSLFKMVMDTQNFSNGNNVIKFSDNSSAIKGYETKVLYATKPWEANIMIAQKKHRHIIFTAETHNFPTGVAPFSGATTGTGGRIRDVHAAGRGAHVIAGTAGYCFGNLNIPGYHLPWEETGFDYPDNLAVPVEIAVEASNGASDYGNKFGEPLISGFARSFGMRLPNGERREWVKPIMFSGGIGSIDADMVTKLEAEKGMEVVKIGGPVYRIGLGGGAASSMVQGDNLSELDFGAVQRGDAEMEQKLNRVIRACLEIGAENPIASIHDQGAGGNGNVLKEIVDPKGAIIKASHFSLGDPTISILELWGAEYQESDAILVEPKHKSRLQEICKREKCPVCFVGTVTGDGRIVLEVDSNNSSLTKPVDLDLECVLGAMPTKTFYLDRVKPKLEPLSLPENLSVMEALNRVLRLPAVASKRYLTNKVDRSVTGLIAQQQCVGPLHTPLADVAVIALSHFDKLGAATAIGEQPIKGLLDPGCGARMAVGEALTNLVFARVTALKDVKCSGNWMWAVKLPGEGAALYDACYAMCEIMKKLGVAIDGGKDSLSMAARVGNETVKAPGDLVISVYAGCPDITATVTPDLKVPSGKGVLLWLDLSKGQQRLGGSALTQCYNQLGDQCPDLDHPDEFIKAFNTTQELIKDNLLMSGHDISDGGLITCILEMAFAGNCGLDIHVPCVNGASELTILFSEELGLILEVEEENVDKVVAAYNAEHLRCHRLGTSSKNLQIKVFVNDTEVINEQMVILRDIWEETSFQLERRQTNPQCVIQEESVLSSRRSPPYHISFDPNIPPAVASFSETTNYPRVAVIREEGNNGDREMIAALYMAHFEVWDVNTMDLLSGKINLDLFHGVIFVGGFSYADVLGSAKGWAASFFFNPVLKVQFEEFRKRKDTFSLGVCNGCQLMALLGWIDPELTEETTDNTKQNISLEHNTSERYESRFVTVRIEKSPSIMLQGMEGSVLGIWVAHGEGRFDFKNKQVFESVKNSKSIAVRYVDDNGVPTQVYPFNPNGSSHAIAGICSSDGQHLAMMPHPERCVLPWQWPWMPLEMKQTMKVSPWLRMFQNAYSWCWNNLTSKE